jgi:hypothetical protein
MKCDDTIQALQIQAVSKDSVWKDYLWQGRVFADCPVLVQMVYDPTI